MAVTPTVTPEVRMTREIARQFADEPLEESAEVIANHLRMSWAPTMIAALLVEADNGADLGPLITMVVARLR